jgi:hypothetical protein
MRAGYVDGMRVLRQSGIFPPFEMGIQHVQPRSFAGKLWTAL